MGEHYRLPGAHCHDQTSAESLARRFGLVLAVEFAEVSGDAPDFPDDFGIGTARQQARDENAKLPGPPER